jgi:hypothetical protein
MKKSIILSLVILVLFASFVSAETEKHSYKPEKGYVPDAATAIKIAEAILVPIYGEKVINEEKPFKAGLKDGIWTVEGTMHTPEGQITLGGVAVIEISRTDGAILRVSHGQ